MSEADRKVIRRALVAAVHGPYFPEWEFSALISVGASDVAGVLAAWPHAAHGLSWERDPTRVQAVVVNNVLNNLVGYPHGASDRLPEDVGATEDELRRVQSRWREACRSLRS